MVFFTGSLQEGISTALQQSKLVVCFVTDDQEESKTWENDFLTDDAIAPKLASDAVVLRLQAGSQEASYLAAIFPLPKTPTVVVIKNGELKEYVAAGTSKEDFVRRVAGAFVSQTAAPIPVDAPAQVATQQSTAAAAAAPRPPPVDTPSSTGQNTPGSSASGTSPTASDADRKRKEKGKMSAEDIQQEPATDPKATQSDAAKKASQENAERRAKAREERARVLKLIADDKAARKARDEQRRQERELERRAAAGEVLSSPVPETSDSTFPTATAADVAPSRKQHDKCALQVRLFDGSTIRAPFPSKATLSREVRKWIDEARTDGADPYTFKVILTPLPNRSIDLATEEEQTLEELGLAPSATLVLAPVEKYSEAYTTLTNGSRNPVSRLVAAVLTFIMNILSGIAGALGGLGSSGGGSGGNQGNDAQQEQASTSGRDAGGRIKGFRDADARRKDHQFYNGNSLSFEPRKDEDDKDK